MSVLYRNKEWRETLDQIMAQMGITLEQIADYIGSPYNGRETIFYARVPQKRKKFIGIGMALKQPLEVINEWILTYSGKRRLYAKDISEDLIWIYLIGLNCRSSSDTNYFNLYEKCQNAAFATYRLLWDEVLLGSIDTSELEIRIRQMDYDDEFEGLRSFIVKNMDSFKTAYSKPRKYLDTYVQCILYGLNADRAGIDIDDISASGHEGRSETHSAEVLRLNSLRGYLDDSMINFLSGSKETVHVYDRSKSFRTLSTKHIPTTRKTHISMCLALGMTAEEINHYLKLMGFGPLGNGDKAEEALIAALEKWEQTHPLQRKFKEEYIGSPGQCEMQTQDMRKAAESMLLLRQDMREEFKEKELAFPYYSIKEKKK